MSLTVWCTQSAPIQPIQNPIHRKLLFSHPYSLKPLISRGGEYWDLAPPGSGQYMVPSRFKVGFPIEVPLRGIARICAIIANTEAIIYWQKCREFRAMEMGFQLKINNFELTHLSNIRIVDFPIIKIQESI